MSDQQDALPVIAHRIDWKPEAGAGLPRFFGADDRGRMRNWAGKGELVASIVDLCDHAAAMARIRELEKQLSEALERVKRIAESAEAAVSGGADKIDIFEVPSHLIAALDEAAPGAEQK